MADPGFTREKLLRARDILRANEVPARVVKDQAEADQITRLDPVGHVWAVGDEYYLWGDMFGKPDLRKAIPTKNGEEA